MAKAKRRRKIVKKMRKVVRKRAQRVKRATAAGMFDIVSNLTSARAELVAQRATLEGQIAALDRALAAMGSGATAHVGVVRKAAGRKAGVGRGRHGRRAGSLKEYIIKVLKGGGGAMAVKDITGGVRRAGYPTKNKTLAKSVGIALTQMPDVRKVGRGKFRAK